MQTNLHTTINSVRRLSHNSLAFLVLAVGTGLIVGTLAFLLLSGQPASESAAATANTIVPAVSFAQERFEEHRWLVQRNAASAASVAATQRQEELKDRWLGYQTADGQTMGDSPSGLDQFDALKEKLMIEYGMIGPAIVPSIQRQEELKDQWLERHQ